MLNPVSDELFSRAKERIPGGVNSPVRAFKAVGRNPIFMARASGSRMWDVDDNEYLDYIGSWGPMILGHGHPQVVAAIQKTSEHGTSFGAPTELEVRMAERICLLVPSMEMVRMVNSGTEATMSAVRLARAFTKCEKIIKFEGCYHGHADSFLIKAGSGALTFGVPDSPGVLPSVASATLTARYNDLSSVEAMVKQYRGEIAALIVEPVVGNMGCVPPKPGFLEGLRTLCTREGVVLIFDEVMTGFRVALGGAQELYGVIPDLTTLGKIIGGGLPVGAYGGKREIMKLVAPDGPMYQAGTLSGNPLAMASGWETLTQLVNDKQCYAKLESVGAKLEEGLADVLKKKGVPSVINRVGSMLTLFFSDGPVIDFESATRSNTKLFGTYFREMLNHGVYLPPSQYEAAFISLAHSSSDIERTLEAHGKSLESAITDN